MNIEKEFEDIQMDSSIEQYLLYMPEISSEIPIQVYVYMTPQKKYRAICNLVICTRIYGGEFPLGEGLSSMEALQNLISRIIYYYQRNKDQGFDVEYDDLF